MASFEIISDIVAIEVIAIGRSIRDLPWLSFLGRKPHLLKRWDTPWRHGATGASPSLVHLHLHAGASVNRFRPSLDGTNVLVSTPFDHA
jgi:hypothetical protein